MKNAALLLLIFIVFSCSKPGGKGGGIQIPSAPIEGSVSNVTFQGLSNGAIILNEDLTLTGTCQSFPDGGQFRIKIDNLRKTVICSAGVFEILFEAYEISAGIASISAEDVVNDKLLTGIIITKNPCNLNQNDSSGSCSDKTIVGAEISIPSGLINVLGTDYAASSNMTISIGGTIEARELYLFQDAVTCGDFIVNNCSADTLTPACSGISFIKRKLSVVTSFPLGITGAVSGSSSSIYGVYVNGSEVSACVSKTVTLDSSDPVAVISMARAVTNNTLLTPVLNLDSVSDVGSGVKLVEFGVGSSPSSPDLIPYSAISSASLSHAADISSLTILTGTNYYSFLRVTDHMNRRSISVSSAWQYVACTGFQTLAAGFCNDNTIAGAQLIINGGTTVGGDLFTTSNALSLSTGTTSDAQKLLLFEAAGDCADYLTNSCQDNPLVSACTAINSSEKGLGVNISYAASYLVHGTQGVVSGLFVNGSEVSACITSTIELDNLSPNMPMSLARLVTNDATVSPKVMIAGGAITDRGNSGIDTLEYAVSSDGVVADLIGYTLVSPLITELQFNIGSFSPVTLTPYKIIMRSVDKLGQTSVWVSSSWEVKTCTPQQTLTTGVCVDNPVSSVQFLVTDVGTHSGRLVSNTATITLSKGTTTPTDKMYFFVSSADCSNHKSLNCHADSSSTGCLGVSSSNRAPSLSMSYSVPGLVHGIAGARIYTYYTNGEAQSSCLFNEVFLDSVGPTLTLSLLSSVSNDPGTAPKVSVSITDNGYAGVIKAEYALSSDGINADITPWTIFSQAAPEITPVAGSVLSALTNYIVLIRVEDNLGNISSWVSGSFTYEACFATQSLVSGACDDNTITSPQLLITNGTTIGPDLFINNSNLVLSRGTTSQALKLFVFETTANCTTYRTNNCHIDNTPVSCIGLTPGEYTPSSSMSLVHSALVSGTPGEVSGFYQNGTEISACLSSVITLDSAAPSFTVALNATETTTMTFAPKVVFNTGATIADVGGSGINKIQFAISSNGVTDGILAYQDISSALTEYTPPLAGALVSVGTDYFTLIKAIDRLGNSFVVSSGAWRYTTCDSFQITEVNGSCTDKAVTGPQLLMAGTSLMYGTKYVASENLTINRGTTAMAKKFFVFPSATSCNDYRSNNCHVDASIPACIAITAVERTPSVSMAYTYPTSLVNNPSVVAGYYANGSQTSACLTDTLARNLPVVSGIVSVPGVDILKTVVSAPTPITNTTIAAADTLWSPSGSPVATTNELMTVTASAMAVSESLLPVAHPLKSSDTTITLSSGVPESCGSTAALNGACTQSQTNIAVSVLPADLDALSKALWRITLGQGVVVTIPYNVTTATQVTAGEIYFPIAWGSDVYFSMTSGSFLSKLFKTNGTTTRMLSNVQAVGDYLNSPLGIIDNELYIGINGSGGGNGHKVYKTDGSTYLRRLSNLRTAGTRDFDTASKLIKFGSSIYGCLWNAGLARFKVHKLTGTSLVPLSNTNTAGDDFCSGRFVEYGGSLYFGGFDNTYNYKIFKTDGTTVKIVKNLGVGVSDSLINPVVFNSQLYFASSNSSGNTKLFRTDGTVIVQVSNIVSGSSDFIADIMVSGSFLYFHAVNATGFRKLFRTDGSTITQVANNNPGGHDDPYDFIHCDGALYLFMHKDSSAFSKLYRLKDNTLTQVSNTNPTGSDFSGSLGSLSCANNTLWFQGLITGGQNRLFKLSTELIQ